MRPKENKYSNITILYALECSNNTVFSPELNENTWSLCVSPSEDHQLISGWQKCPITHVPAVIFWCVGNEDAALLSDTIH